MVSIFNLLMKYSQTGAGIEFPKVQDPCPQLPRPGSTTTFRVLDSEQCKEWPY